MKETDQFHYKIYSSIRKLGCNHIQASLGSGQAPLESGWGRKVKGNAYYGIKAGRSWKGDTIDFQTQEVIKGRRVNMADKFRKYPSLQAATEDYVRMMRVKFSNAWNAKTLEAACEGLNNGRFGRYATDEDYHTKVRQITEERSIKARERFEGKGTVVKPVAPKRAAAGRPQQSREITNEVLKQYNHLVPAESRNDDVFILAVRGYFRDSKGKVGENDRGIYDDALFISSPRGHWAFTANVDPSVHRTGVASYDSGQAIPFFKGIHGHSKPKNRRYAAFEQGAAARFHRDGSSKQGLGDQSMNIHRGSKSGRTSSLGCITLPYGDWPEFFKTACDEIEHAGQAGKVWLVLLEYSGGLAPIKRPVLPPSDEEIDKTIAKRKVDDKSREIIDDLDKPALDSKTVWGAIKTYIGNALSFVTAYITQIGTWFSELPVWAQVSIVGFILVFALIGLWGVYQVVTERLPYRKKSQAVKGIKH